MRQNVYYRRQVVREKALRTPQNFGEIVYGRIMCMIIVYDQDIKFDTHNIYVCICIDSITYTNRYEEICYNVNERQKPLDNVIMGHLLLV